MCKSYDDSLNLPKTKFSMRANLPSRDGELFKKYEKEKLYEKIMTKNKDKKLYILHDGPPYANGDIHLGTALNKILKDFIVKQKNMTNHKAPFVPGWDTHGLPIELKAIKSEKKNRNNLSSLELRKICKDYALKYIDIQREQFKKIGVLGDFSHPYLTFQKEFEAEQIKVFGEMLKKGYIYKGLKPVYWCCKCNTALAESEIEYENDECDSIYVGFKVKDDDNFFNKIGIKKENTYFLIWTTTTWTLPGNLAICVSDKIEYSVVKVDEKYYIIAKDLIESCMKDAGKENYEIVTSFNGKLLENITVQHPFIDRESLVILGNHVTLDAGTGCVHTAPGHGVEDFEVCKKYPNIPIKVVVDENGNMTKDAYEFEGLNINDANKKILEKLKQVDALFGLKRISHNYPHCWRCKEPILFRATKQWFCSINKFKEKALEESKKVNWIPKWGENKIENMIQNRTDWCISRQRVWGVPIPIIYCSNCNEYIVNDRLIENTVNMFKIYGSDCWFEKDVKDFLPSDFSCPFCGNAKDFKKETDIMDVWFDSGCSHAAVLKNNENLKWPADLYLEGADQYRGWFQSSLLTSVAFEGKSPYKSVCTHGWVVDGEGRKMSKSLANGVKPEKFLSKYGADILRLWVASSDYHSDIKISEDIIKQLIESYRKIRNTARFILGNLYDFNPENDMIGLDEVQEIDKWALVKLDMLIKANNKSYEDFKFYNIYHNIHNFCIVDMSNFYLDVIKDRLYCEAKFSKKRRAAQTTIYVILDALTRMIAPILAFSSEEIWSFLPHKEKDLTESILLNDMYSNVDIEYNTEFCEKWDKILKIRDFARKALEEKRKEKKIGSSLEAKVIIYCSEENFKFLDSIKNLLKDVFIVSEVVLLNDGDGEYKFKNFEISLDIKRAEGGKCQRCWNYSKSVGDNSDHSSLCKRCCSVIN